jgi:molybdopterin synthase sulfur carrier subunit
VKVQFFATIRENERQWDQPAATVRDLLLGLASRYGARLEQKMITSEGLNPAIIVLVNGRNVVHLSGLDTPLAPDDVVSIFPMVAGGASVSRRPPVTSITAAQRNIRK